MIQDAIFTYRQNILLLAGMSAVLVGFEAFTSDGPNAGIQIIVLVYVTFRLHLAILVREGYIEENDKTARNPGFGFFAMILGAMVLVVLLSMYAASQMFAAGLDLDQARLAILPVTIVFIGLLLALFGTAIPAKIDDRDSAIGWAWRNVSRTFLPVLGRLIVGPFVWIILMFTLSITLAANGLPPVARMPSGVISASGAILSFALGALGMFGSALTAAVLSRAYVRLSHPRGDHRRGSD